MCYTVNMRARVECSCGWKRELSQFYAGKRIRCADCGTVLEVPGISGGLYSSRKLERNLNRPASRKGVWLPLTSHPDAHKPRPASRSCASRTCGNSIFFIMIAVIVALNIGRILRDDEVMQRQESAPVVESEDLAEPGDAPKSANPGKKSGCDVEAEDEF